jgi:glutamate synthase (NADPH/NADH) small chain
MRGASYAARLAADRLEARLVEGTMEVLDDSRAARAASRCLYCWDAPCTRACPAGVDVGRFVWDVASRNVRGAARTILKANALGLTCARVCPTPSLCEGSCVLRHAGQPPVEIAALQLYAVAKAREAGFDPFPQRPPSGKRVALVGAGPASLACAHALALLGHACTLYEARELPGGLSTYALAPYKLPASDALADVEWVTRLDAIEVRCGVEVGRDVTVQALVDEYDAVFLGVGLGEDTIPRVAGHDLPGVVGALDLVRRLKLARAGDVRDLDGVRDALVVGGGSTALDVAQELKRLGMRNVTFLYRRDQASMPGHAHELDETRRLGVVTRFLSVPVAYLAGPKGRVARVRVARCALGERGADGRPQVSVVEADVVELEAQLVAVATGQKRPGETLASLPGLEFTADGRIATRDAGGRTSVPRLYAAGDCVSGGEELVHAVAAGRRAAEAIHACLAEERSCAT